MVTNMKAAVFRDIAPCSLLDIDRRFTGAYCHHHRSVSTRLHGTTSQKTAIFNNDVMCVVEGPIWHPVAHGFLAKSKFLLYLLKSAFKLFKIAA
jgi:hypothetical protein